MVADLLVGHPIIPPACTPSDAAATPWSTITDLVERYLQHTEGYCRKDDKPASEVHMVRRALEFLTLHHSELLAAAFRIGGLKVVR